MYSTGNSRNIENHVKKICTIKGASKNFFLSEWREIFKESYLSKHQYGFCNRNSTYGVLTPKGTWSPVNQFNTHYTVNVKIIEKLNEWIFTDFFLKGTNEINGEKIKEITFENNSSDYIELELKNYFKWLRYYKDKIFIDHNLIGPSDFIYELFTIASKTIGTGTYGELCIEQYFKKNVKTSKIYRTSLVRGSTVDMVNGCDLFTVNNEDKTKIIMEEKIDDIFNSKIFYEFFMYCSRNDIEFSLEVSEDTILNYIKDENKVIVSLPTSSDKFDTDKIYEVWVEIINSISKKQEDIDFMMSSLKNFFKK